MNRREAELSVGCWMFVKATKPTKATASTPRLIGQLSALLVIVIDGRFENEDEHDWRIFREFNLIVVP